MLAIYSYHLEPKRSLSSATTKCDELKQGVCPLSVLRKAEFLKVRFIGCLNRRHWQSLLKADFWVPPFTGYVKNLGDPGICILISSLHDSSAYEGLKTIEKITQYARRMGRIYDFSNSYYVPGNGLVTVTYFSSSKFYSDFLN